MNKFVSFLVMAFISSGAIASSAGESHGESHGIPPVVFYQTINVLIILVTGIFYGRPKVAQFFKQKRNQFLLDQNKAQSFLQAAQVEHSEAKRRLEKLRSTYEEAISKAGADANDLKKQLIQDAEQNAKKMKTEASQMARFQIEKAKKEVRTQLIVEAFELSKKDLSGKATSADQKKLQEDFISKVQVVQ